MDESGSLKTTFEILRDKSRNLSLLVVLKGKLISQGRGEDKVECSNSELEFVSYHGSCVFVFCIMEIEQSTTAILQRVF